MENIAYKLFRGHLMSVKEKQFQFMCSLRIKKSLSERPKLLRNR